MIVCLLYEYNYEGVPKKALNVLQ